MSVLLDTNVLSEVGEPSPDSNVQAYLIGLADLWVSVVSVHARRAAHFRAESHRRGRVLHLPDALIAATAKEHSLTLATRNICDFDYLGIDVVNPWRA